MWNHAIFLRGLLKKSAFPHVGALSPSEWFRLTESAHTSISWQLSLFQVPHLVSSCNGFIPYPVTLLKREPLFFFLFLINLIWSQFWSLPPATCPHCTARELPERKQVTGRLQPCGKRVEQQGEGGRERERVCERQYKKKWKADRTAKKRKNGFPQFLS